MMNDECFAHSVVGRVARSVGFPTGLVRLKLTTMPFTGNLSIGCDFVNFFSLPKQILLLLLKVQDNESLLRTPYITPIHNS